MVLAGLREHGNSEFIQRCVLKYFKYLDNITAHMTGNWHRYCTLAPISFETNWYSITFTGEFAAIDTNS